VLSVAKDRFGPHFASVLTNCKIWLNGEEVHESTPVTGKDEVAVLPPVSGGSQ
jgi:molybdopterin converting factor small subunit